MDFLKVIFPKLYELSSVDLSHNNIMKTWRSVFTPIFSIRDFIHTSLKMKSNRGSDNMDGPSKMKLDNLQTVYKLFVYVKHTLEHLMANKLITGKPTINDAKLYTLLSRAESVMNDRPERETSCYLWCAREPEAKEYGRAR